LNGAVEKQIPPPAEAVVVMTMMLWAVFVTTPIEWAFQQCEDF